MAGGKWRKKKKVLPAPTPNTITDLSESDTVDKKSGDTSVVKKKQTVSSNWLKLDTTSAGKKRKRLVVPDQDEEPEKKKMKVTEGLPSVISEDKSITKIIAIDCEMVGVGTGEESALARVVIVNGHGNVIYDKFVSPKETVVDYRTKVSGIREKDLIDAPSFDEVQKEVAEIMEGRIVIGHGLENDFKVLLLAHPFAMTRDTAKFRPLQRRKNKPHSLKWLSKTHLGVEIQSGEHSPDVDARAALLLYNKFKKEWETKLKIRKKKKFSNPRIPKKMLVHID